MPFLLAALLAIAAASSLPGQTNSQPGSAVDKPKRTPDYWGARLEAHVGATFYGSPNGNGVGQSHRFIGQAAWLRGGSPFTPVLFGLDGSFDQVLVARERGTASLFHWSASAIGSAGINFGVFSWKPFVTWGNLGMYLNAIVGVCGLENSIEGIHEIGVRAGGEVSTGQFPFPHYDGIVLRMSFRGGFTAEAFSSPRLTLLNAWCTLCFYPAKLVAGFFLTYRFIGNADGNSGFKSHYLSFGIAVQL